MTDLGQAELLPDALADETVVSAWRDLAVLRSNPFLTPEWTRTALAAYPGQEPAIAVWRRRGEVRGVLPLVGARRGPFHFLGFPAARRADWVTPACRVEDEEEMGAAVARLLGRSRQTLRLERLDEACAWPAALAGGEGLAAVAERADVLPFVKLGAGGFEQYMAGRSRNFRSQLGRRRRKLERDHALSFRMTADPGELDADLDAFLGLHDERFASRGEASSQDEGARRHLRAFAAAALERGWLRLWIAEADGEPAAAWYGWRVGARYCYALSGLRSSFEKLALGNVMLAHTIEQAAAEGAEVYDLMWGDEEYKQRFETGRRTARTWTVTRAGGVERVAIAAAVRGRRALAGLPPGLKRPLARVRTGWRR